MYIHDIMYILVATLDIQTQVKSNLKHGFIYGLFHSVSAQQQIDKSNQRRFYLISIKWINYTNEKP